MPLLFSSSLQPRYLGVAEFQVMRNSVRPFTERSGKSTTYGVLFLSIHLGFCIVSPSINFRERQFSEYANLGIVLL